MAPGKTLETPSEDLPQTIGAWLSVPQALVFWTHVGRARGAAGRFATAAIVEKLTREGAFKASDHARALESLRSLDAEAAALVVDFAEIIRRVGPSAVRALVHDLATRAADEAGERRR